MLFRRIESEGLAHNSYFLGDAGVAVVIDPRRDIDVYLRLAHDHGVRIQRVLETHRNEDYVIGSTALADATGAEILHSARTPFEYGTAVRSGDGIGVGRLRLSVLETPGHTPDSLTFALADTSAGPDPYLVFTGDALFVGDTGRIDLLGPEMKRRQAEFLYDSLFRKILPLGDWLTLCPAHGAGSVCGAGISDRDPSTLGFERRHNPQLQFHTAEPFIKTKLSEKHIKPPYFERMEEWNQRGTAPIYPRLPVPPPLSPGELAELIHDDVLVVDARMPQSFAGGHVPRSYNIWRAGLSSYLGWIVPVGAPLALVLPQEADVEQVTRTLLRIGYDDVVGYLRGGFEAWQNEGREVERTGTIDTVELRSRMRRGMDLEILDVRTPGEWEGGTIEGARRIFVGELEGRARDLPRGRPMVTMCSVGHRGGVAASILARLGFREVYNYLGGYTAWKRRR